MIRVSNVRFTTASDAERERGLLGWVAFTVNDLLRLDGITLRRTLKGRLSLSFPERRDPAGGTHPYIRPVDARAHANVTAQVLAALGFAEHSATAP